MTQVNLVYLHNIKKGLDTLRVEQQRASETRLAIRKERATLTAARRKLGLDPLPTEKSKHLLVVEAENRVRVCKKYIENNILAYGFGAMYRRKEVISTLVALGSPSLKTPGSPTHTRSQDIYAALQHLNDLQYSCVIHRYVHSRGYPEIGKRLKITPYFAEKEADSALVNICVLLNRPVVREIERRFLNYMLEHSLDLQDIYMEACADTSEVVNGEITPDALAGAVVLPGDAPVVLTIEIDIEEVSGEAVA